MTTKLAAYVGNPNEFDTTEQAATTAEWNSLAGAMGQAPTMMLTYLDETHPLADWIGDAQWAVGSWQASAWLAGVIPNISVPMTLQGDNADADFKAIASGAWDYTLTGVLQTWASAGYTTLYLRPGWEMNGNWMDWSVTAANATDFVAAFQHIASLAHSFSGATVEVVWSPNEGAYSSVPISSYYPGNSAVDIIGIDTYGQPIDSDATPSAVATGPNDYTLETALSMAQANGKPFALAETGGTDATFPTNLAAVVASSGVPLDYVALWDANASGGNLVWSNNSADAAAWKAAYQEMAAQGAGSIAVPPSTSTPTSVSVSPVIASLTNAQGTRALVANSALATITQVGGSVGDNYSYALGGKGGASFSLSTTNNSASLSSGASGVAGSANGKLYALTLTAIDTTSGQSSPAVPFDVVIGGSGGDTISLSALTGSLAASTPTFIYGLAGADTLNGTGMTGQLWFIGGAGADTMTGGSGVNHYLYAAIGDSTPKGMDIITNFHAAVDMIDLTGLGSSLRYAGQVGTRLAAHSIGWQISGGNTFISVNNSGSTESLTAVNMKIELRGSISLSSANILHA
jgi:hypothetical protein